MFIDVGSFERLRPGEPWAGYRQFCMLFLYPLMLQAYKDLPFHALLRGSLDGITPREARGAARRRPLPTGVLTQRRSCTRGSRRATPTPAAARSSAR